MEKDVKLFVYQLLDASESLFVKKRITLADAFLKSIRLLHLSRKNEIRIVELIRTHKFYDAAIELYTISQLGNPPTREVAIECLKNIYKLPFTPDGIAA